MFNNLKKTIEKQIYRLSGTRFSFGVGGEPPFFDSLALLEDLADAPE